MCVHNSCCTNIYIYIIVQCELCTHTVLCKSLRPIVFSPTKNGFKSVISTFCCSVSVGNISLHFQTFILLLIVIIQWDFCLHKESDNSQCSTQRSEMTWRTEPLRQTKSRRTVATSPRCFKKPNYKATSISAPRAKAALNAKDGHIKCWFNKSELMNKSIYDIIFESILTLHHFTQSA